MADLDIILARLNDLDSKISNLPVATAPPPPEIINSEELARRLDISEPTVINWRRKKKIPFIKVDGVIRYNWPRVVEQLETKSTGK
jgi:hypothetical protein